MKKSELENGMIVELRNGGKYMVIRNFTNKTIRWTENILLGYENNYGYMTLEDYFDDLYCIENISISKEYDIMKVFCLEKCRYRKLRLLWERKEKYDYNDVLDCLSKIYKGGVGVEPYNNGYRFKVYTNDPNEPVTAFIDKQKLEKTQLYDVVKLLEKELDKEIVRAYKI